jgi:hypothetical protein
VSAPNVTERGWGLRASWVIIALAVVACDDQKNYSWPRCPMVPSAGPFLVDSAEIAGWSSPFSVAIHGVVDDATIRSLDFQNGRGTVALSSGSASSVLYDQYDFDGYRGYTAIVPTRDRWHVLYPYCKGESLRTVWHFETGSQRLRELPASGSCTGTDGASVTAGISLSTSTLNLPNLCGLEIEQLVSIRQPKTFPLARRSRSS